MKFKLNKLKPEQLELIINSKQFFAVLEQLVKEEVEDAMDAFLNIPIPSNTTDMLPQMLVARYKYVIDTLKSVEDLPKACLREIEERRKKEDKNVAKVEIV